MGSLVSGWDSQRAPGKAPPGFQDFAEPVSPRCIARMPSTGLKEDASATEKAGPPSLVRTSAPPIHGASAMQRYLSRSSGAAAGTSAPASPHATTPRSATTPRAAHKHLTLKVGEGEEYTQALKAKEKWCSRVDSASLNQRPDEGDKDSWRHGSFKLDDACHATHFAPSPTAAAAHAHAADGLAPFTPPAGVQGPPVVAEGPRVTVARLPQEATESFDSAAL